MSVEPGAKEKAASGGSGPIEIQARGQESAQPRYPVPNLQCLLNDVERT